jgi:diguanylate cyclase (GGDEF)-like protein
MNPALRRNMRLRFWLGLGAVCAIALGSVAGALVVRANDRDDFERVQRDEALRSARQAEALTALSIGQLESAAAFYRLEPSLSRHEFKVLAGSLLSGGALSATAFVDASDECCPIAQVESKVGTPPEPGFDLSSDPQHAAAMRRARDGGGVAITDVAPTLIGPGPGLVVYQPVYRDGAAIRTVAQRRAALLGFAAGAFRAPDLAAAATAAIPRDIEVQLLEKGAPVIGPDEPLAESATAPVRIADRTWLLVVRDPDRPGVALPILMAVFGLALAALLGALVVIWSRNEQVQELQRQASQDALTGLKNWRRFQEDLRGELARSRREGVEGALLMLDLDHFKEVNDTLGHPVGDQVIGEIAGVLRGRMRETDVLARLGGDEFAIVLPRCDADEARAVAEAIATAIREHVPQRDGLPRITASIGIATFGTGTEATFESVQHDADAAMYAAKQAGRDAVRLSRRDDAAARAPE